MKIVFLGYAVNTDQASLLSGASVAGNKMQVNILKELVRYEDVSLQCVTVYPVAAWPRERLVRISSKNFLIDDTVQAVRASFLNFPVVKQLSQVLSVYRTAKRVVDQDTVLLTFNVYPQIGLPAMWLKKKYGCKVCAIFADPPIDDKKDRTGISRILRGWFDYFTKKAISACDGLIALNAYAVHQYAPEKKHIIVEGGVSLMDFPKEPHTQQPEKKNLIYSGALTEYSGIVQLINAMQKIANKEAILEIYGGGYLEEEIRRKCSAAQNIRYCGKVSNAEMVKIQRNAYLLVNPRPIDDPITKVTFPSKLFEYMLSATPVLTTKINGLTNEYLQHLYYTEDDTPDGLAKAIDDVLNIDEMLLRAKGAEAQQFVQQHKTWNKQCEKIHVFLNELTDSHF